jgi:hypothetical protein
VSERLVISKIRTGPVKPPAGEELVGYAILKKAAKAEPCGGFVRRIFTLKKPGEFRDPHVSRECPAPEDAVDPMYVRAGAPGRRVSSKP